MLALDSQTLSITATCFQYHGYRQKYRTQNPVLARGCGFKSHLRYFRLTSNRGLRTACLVTNR